MNRSLYLLALLCFVSNCSAFYANFTFQFSMEMYQYSDEKASFILRYSKTPFTDVWFGIGIGTDKDEESPDIIMVEYTSSSSYTISDRKGHSESAVPTSDTTNNLEDTSCNENSVEIVCEFKRQLATGDSADTEFTESSRVPLIWALGALSGGTPASHSNTERGASSIKYSGAYSAVSLITTTALLIANFLF